MTEQRVSDAPPPPKKKKVVSTVEINFFQNKPKINLENKIVEKYEYEKFNFSK